LPLELALLDADDEEEGPEELDDTPAPLPLLLDEDAEELADETALVVEAPELDEVEVPALDADEDALALLAPPVPLDDVDPVDETELLDDAEVLPDEAELLEDATGAPPLPPALAAGLPLPLLEQAAKIDASAVTERAAMVARCIERRSR
jgi:hypothetical protein